jgi:hypothetical protein
VKYAMSVCSRGMVNNADEKVDVTGSARQHTRSLEDGIVLALLLSYRLPIVRIAPRGGRHVRVDLDKRSAQYPAALAGRETRREHSIVDLAGYGEATEHRRGKIQPFVVGKPSVAVSISPTLAVMMPWPFGLTRSTSSA